VPRDRGSHGAVRLCSDACSGPSGAVTERTEGAVSVAYVLQDLLTTTDVRTRMAQLGSWGRPGTRTCGISVGHAGGLHRLI
jgi:hypothetical protein